MGEGRLGLDAMKQCLSSGTCGDDELREGREAIQVPGPSAEGWMARQAGRKQQQPSGAPQRSLPDPPQETPLGLLHTHAYYFFPLQLTLEEAHNRAHGHEGMRGAEITSCL